MDIESIQIHLNSKYADFYNNNNSSDCVFQLPVIEIPSQHSIKLSVQHALIPFSFYNINENNNKIQLQEIVVDANNVPTGQTINNLLYMAYGNYNAYQLASYLGTIFPGNRTTVTYSSIYNKFTIINSTYDFIFLYESSTCQDILGLLNDNFNVSGNKNFTSRKLIDLAPVRCICLATNLQTGCINLNNQNEPNILCSIAVNTNPFSLIEFKNNNNYKVDLRTNVFNTINIKLIDQDGKLINLNDMYFTVTLQLDVVNFVE